MSAPTDATNPSVFTVTTEAGANEARTKALVLMDQLLFEAALELLGAVLAYRCSRHGELHPTTGVAYLDYGLALLGLLQSADPENAALADNVDRGELRQAALASGDADPTLGLPDEEDYEVCFQNLDAARVCFERADAALAQGETDPDRTGGMDKQTARRRLAEAHDTLGQFHEEHESELEAIDSFKRALELFRTPEAGLPPHHLRIIATLRSLSRVYVSVGVAQDAVPVLREAVELLRAGGVDREDPEAFQDAVEALEDTERVVAQGGMQAVTAEIKELLQPEEAESQVQAVTTAVAAASRGNGLFAPMTGATGEAHTSGGASLMLAPGVAVPLLTVGEASNSISLFPQQGGRASSATAHGGPVHTNVAVRRKVRPADSASQPLPAAGQRRERDD
jgi:tetratricopeptide (TPR) repeat protein